MARVILFGGGDAGGLIIGPNGVRPIPPFDPGIRKQLKAVASLTQALAGGGVRERRELSALTTKLANHVVGDVEAVIGTLDRDASLVYQDDGGGFTCGSTGKPPIPFPWPPRDFPGIDDLVLGGVLESELVGLLRHPKLDIKTLLADPRAAAERAGVKLSARSLEQLSRISPSEIDKIPDAEGREVAQYFHKVVEDGRFLESWSLRPHEVATSLGVKLSDGAVDRIIAGGNAVLRPGGGGENANAAIGIAVMVGVVIMLVTRDPEKVIDIRDRSGLQKF